MRRFMFAVVAVLIGALPGWLLAQTGGTLKITSFEAGQPKFTGDGQVVADKEHATDGDHVLKLETQGESFANFVIDDRAVLPKFKDYVLLKIDVFNPQDYPVTFTSKVEDDKSKNYGSRYNNDNNVAPPGKSTFELNLTGLTRSNARNFAERQKLDLDKLKSVSLFYTSGRGKTILYLDNVRLESSGLPVVEGLKAYDFGPAKSPVYPGFEGVTDQHLYTKESGYGFIDPVRSDNVYMPDDLTGDWVAAKEFRVNLPNGQYELNLCMDHFGLWHTFPYFQWRKLLINGKEALSERYTGEEFMDKLYFAQEDQEDLPGQDAWEKFIAPRNVMRRFSTEVSDGVLRIEASSDMAWGQAMSFLVVYPQSKQAEGRKWMDTLQQKRKTRFNELLVVRVPEVTGDEPQPSDADKARGFIPFVRHTEQDVAVNARPAKGEAGAAIKLQAAQGEREHAQLGLYVLEDLKGATVKMSDLAGPQGKSIAGSAVQVRKIRNFLKRSGSTMMGEIQPRILQEFTNLDLQKNVTRGLWLTVIVPSDAAPGKYTGNLTVGAGDKTAQVPVELTVFPFRLDRDAAGITLSVTGSTAGHWRGWYPDLDQRWWKTADLMMAEQYDHGMNAVTGGPGGTLKAIKDGKAEIDYSTMDRWMELAVKHGLTRAGDSYQGFDIGGVPLNQGPKAIEVNDQDAQSRFGVSYAELIKAVYGDVARHAKEKNWPPRSYSFLDEPRPEYGNVEEAAKLIQVRTKAAPDVLFSGYYSTGDGRDVYFETMPVSIAHLDAKSVELVKKGGKQLWDYDGGGSRHNIGRWAFLASQNGLKGYLRNGYMYVCSNPYFDFSDDEASWCVVYPSRKGISATTGWERTAQGTNDFYYLSMLDKLVKSAREGNKAKAEADAAEAYLKQTLGTVDLYHRETARLTGQQYDQFKATLAQHIAALSKAVGAGQ